MALAITSRVPRMRNSTRNFGTDVHERARRLIDQLDFDATRLLEEMTMELQNHEHKAEKSSLPAVLNKKIILLEQEKSKLQTDLSKLQVISSHYACNLFATWPSPHACCHLQKRLKSMRKTMELFLDHVKLANNASTPAKDLLADMRAILDGEDAHEPRMPTEHVEPSQSRSNRANDSRQPQHQHQTETAQPRGTATPSKDVPNAPRSSPRPTVPAPPRNEVHARSNPIQRRTRDSPPRQTNGPAVPVCLQHITAAVEQMLHKSKCCELF